MKNSINKNDFSNTNNLFDCVNIYEEIPRDIVFHGHLMKTNIFNKFKQKRPS